MNPAVSLENIGDILGWDHSEQIDELTIESVELTAKA